MHRLFCSYERCHYHQAGLGARLRGPAPSKGAHPQQMGSCAGAKATVYPPIVPVSSNQAKSISPRDKDQRSAHSALNGAEAVVQGGVSAFKRLKKIMESNTECVCVCGEDITNLTQPLLHLWLFGAL